MALFPFAAIGVACSRLRRGRRGLGALAGYAVAGMSRQDLKELGHTGTRAGLAGGVAASDMGAKVERAMKKAKKVEAGQLKAETVCIEAYASLARATCQRQAAGTPRAKLRADSSFPGSPLPWPLPS